MAKKHVTSPITAAGAAPARVVKAATPRTRTAKHSKAVTPEIPAPEVVTEVPLGVEIADNPMEVISKLAYGYWEARGGHGGSELEDWARAEEEYRRGLTV